MELNTSSGLPTRKEFSEWVVSCLAKKVTKGIVGFSKLQTRSLKPRVKNIIYIGS